MAQRKTVAVDLDGVLARYDGWQGVDHFGEPLPGSRAFLRKLRETFEVVIFTTRCNAELNREGANLLRNRVRDWLDAHGFEYDHIHAEQGKPPAVAFIDDRAVGCRPQDYENPVDAYADAILETMWLSEPEDPETCKVPPIASDATLPELVEIRTALQRDMAREG